MAKRSWLSMFILLGGGLLLSLTLLACDDVKSGSSNAEFKSFREVSLAASVQAAIKYYNLTIHVTTDEQAIYYNNLVEKYYTSDESDLEKLANEVDATMTAQGYVFDVRGSKVGQGAGATKPINLGDYWTGGYSKPGAPDFVFSLSLGSKWYGGSNLKWLEVAGANPDDLQKLKQTLDSSKSVLYTRTANGMFTAYAPIITPTPKP